MLCHGNPTRRRRVQAIRAVYNTTTPTTPAAATNPGVVHVAVELCGTGEEIFYWEDIVFAFKHALNIRHETNILPFMDSITSALRALQGPPAAGPDFSLHSMNLPAASSTFELAPRPELESTCLLAPISVVHPNVQPALKPVPQTAPQAVPRIAPQTKAQTTPQTTHRTNLQTAPQTTSQTAPYTASQSSLQSPPPSPSPSESQPGKTSLPSQSAQASAQPKCINEPSKKSTVVDEDDEESSFVMVQSNAPPVVTSTATGNAQPIATNSVNAKPSSGTPLQDEASADKDSNSFVSAIGDIHAIVSLAEAYGDGKEGHGVMKDTSKAAFWYSKAAFNGSAKSQSNLGILYIKGDGVEKNNALAMQWLVMAAKQGNTSAQFSLGCMYYRDEGVPENRNKAMAWLSKAAKGGYALALEAYKDIQDEQPSPDLSNKKQRGASSARARPLFQKQQPIHPPKKLAEVMLITQKRPQERVQAIRPIYKNTPSTSTAAVPTTPPSNLEIVQIEIRLDSDGKDIVLWDDILSAFKNAVNIRRGVKVLPFLKDNEFRNLDPLRITAVPNTVLDVLVEDLSVSSTAVPAALTPPPSPPWPSPSSVPESPAQLAPQLVPQLEPEPALRPVFQAMCQTSTLLASALPPHSQPKTTRRLESRPTSQLEPQPALHSVLLSPPHSPPSSTTTLPSRIHDLDPEYTDEDAKDHAKNYTSVNDSSSDENDSTPSANVKSLHSTRSTEKNRLSYLDNSQDATEDITYTFVKAQQGDFRSQFRLAIAYKNGSNGLFQSDESAMGWFLKAAEQGHAGAECELGLLYEAGQGGVEKDDVTAVEWYRKAANHGHADAQKNLAFMYAQGWGVEEDLAEAARWYRKAAGQGHASAQFRLGVLYTQGQGVPKDGFKACEWFRKAASQGHIDARQGGIHKNYSKAMNQFQKAAAEGHREAQFHIGIMHANGLGVPQDDEKAVLWFYKAAEQCHAEAQSCLAVLFFKGRGVVQDHEEALCWFLKAASQGHIPSMFNLGIIYSSKRFLDRSLAMNWYLKAADGGYKGAREAYETLRAQPQ
ncbi:hypothetical protein BGZ91_002002 [Linnemannia elongata]|nr:hypothetical protein BGZ91_002002 [Linnemannia elongata]